MIITVEQVVDNQLERLFKLFTDGEINDDYYKEMTKDCLCLLLCDDQTIEIIGGEDDGVRV